MTTTFSPSLKLALMATGDQSGTWGNTTNTNLGTLLEQAITGVGAISLTGLTSYTLTNLNGIVSDSRNQVLVFNGSPATTVTIVAPLQNKFYIVTNATGQNITMTASGGAVSLVIPTGVTAQCYCDAYNVSGTGTGFYSAQTGSAGNFNVNGTLTSTGLTDTGNLSVGGTFTATAGATTLKSLTINGSALTLNGSVSGSVIVSAPATAGSTTVIFPATTAAGVVMVSANMPAFSAYFSGSQTIVNNTSTVITVNTKTPTPNFYDTAGAFNNTGSTVTLNGLSVPAYAFCPPVAGYYQVFGTCNGQGSTGTYLVDVEIIKNGSNPFGFSVGSFVYNAATIYTNAISNISSLVYLNGTGDYIQLTGRVSGTGTETISTSLFQASLVRTA